jgi:putative copper resistance protein D
MWVDALSVSLRGLGFVALFQAAGIVIFAGLSHHELKGKKPMLRLLGTVSALVAAVLLTGQYVLEAARMSGELNGAIDPALQRLVMHSATSVTLSWRLLGLLLIILGLRRPGALGTIVGVVGVVMLLAAFTFVGHTSKDTLRWLLSPVLLAHLFAVAFWFGALAPLYLISSREPPAIAGRSVARFSAQAVWIVPGLLVTGLILAMVLLPSVAALDTAYGHLLIVKLAGFLALMGFAVWNKWRLGPALGRGDVRAARSFRLSLAGEYVLIAAVLCVTAALTMFYSPEG